MKKLCTKIRKSKVFEDWIRINICAEIVCGVIPQYYVWHTEKLTFERSFTTFKVLIQRIHLRIFA